MKRAYVVGLLGVVVGSFLGVAACGEANTTNPPRPAGNDTGTGSDTGTAGDGGEVDDDSSVPGDGGGEGGGSGETGSCTVKLEGKISELRDPASSKKAIVNDVVKVNGVVATSRKFRIQNVSKAGDSCLFGVFVADANATFEPYSGILVISYGKNAEPRDGGGATCPLGTDHIPEDVRPGHTFDITASYTEFASSASFCGGLTPPLPPPTPNFMPQLFKVCSMNRTGTEGTAPAPAAVTKAQIEDGAADLPKYTAGLVKVEDIEAATKVGANPDRNFGKFKVKDAKLKVGDKIWYRGQTMTVDVGDQFDSVTGLMYLDFCEWTLESNACADMVVKSGFGPVCPSTGG